MFSLSASLRSSSVLSVLIAAGLTLGGSSSTGALTGALKTDSEPCSALQNGSLKRTAERLQARVRKASGKTYSLDQLACAIKDERELLQHSVTVSLLADNAATFEPWVVSFSRYPGWLHAQMGGAFSFVIDTDAMRSHLRQYQPEQLPLPVNATLKRVYEEQGVWKAEVEGIAEPGYEMDTDAVVSTLQAALATGKKTEHIAVHAKAGTIQNQTGEDMGDLALLATGRSDFAGSGEGRKSNVRLGLQEHLINTVVPADADFSFNATMHNMRDSGWQDALGIFNGSELRNVRGGGICQVATTLYRSLVYAGLPVTQRANHSLYVTYYEKFNVGLDATIFPHAQDLAFHNDTGHPLLIQSSVVGTEAFVRIYGTSDGRSVTLAGPYFAGNAPSDVTVSGRAVKGNEITWVQTVTKSDGSLQRNVIVSRYNAIPRTLIDKYPPTEVRVASL